MLVADDGAVRINSLNSSTPVGGRSHEEVNDRLLMFDSHRRSRRPRFHLFSVSLVVRVRPVSHASAFGGNRPGSDSPII